VLAALRARAAGSAAGAPATGTPLPLPLAYTRHGIGLPEPPHGRRCPTCTHAKHCNVACIAMSQGRPSNSATTTSPQTAEGSALAPPSSSWEPEPEPEPDAPLRSLTVIGPPHAPMVELRARSLSIDELDPPSVRACSCAPACLPARLGRPLPSVGGVGAVRTVVMGLGQWRPLGLVNGDRWGWSMANRPCPPSLRGSHSPTFHTFQVAAPGPPYWDLPRFLAVWREPDGAGAGGVCTWAAQTPEQLQEMSRQGGGWGRPWAELSAESKRLVLCLKNEWSAYIFWWFLVVSGGF
jgi:hypothetical protein